MRFNLFVICTACFWLGGCMCDDFSEEVVLETTFNGIRQPLFTEIKVENAIKDIPLQPEVRSGDTTYYYLLPVDSNRDTTTYFFKRAERWDTLRFSYERKFEFKKDECGFVMEIDRAKIHKNTFPYRAFMELWTGRAGFPNARSKSAKLTFMP